MYIMSYLQIQSAVSYRTVSACLPSETSGGLSFSGQKISRIVKPINPFDPS